MLRATTILGFSLLGLLFPSAAAGEQHGAHHARRHSELARRVPGDVVPRGSSHTNARYSWYDVGLGACGQTSAEGDYIVALNADEFGSGYPGPNCFKSITISYNGKQTQAQILDRCPGCPYGGLDMSKGLFQFFEPLGTGIFYGEWWYTGDGPSQSTTSQAAPTSTYVPPTTTSSTYVPPPTTSSTYVPPTTSSTYVAPTTSATPTPTTTTSSSSQAPRSTSQPSSAPPSSSALPERSASVVPSESSSAAAATATGGVKNDGTGTVLEALNQAILGMSGLIAQGAQAS